MNLFFIEVLCDYLSIRAFFFLPPLLFFLPMEMCANRFSFTIHLEFIFVLHFHRQLNFFSFFFFVRCVLLMLTFYFYAKSLCSNRMVESCDKGEKEKKIIKMICKTMKRYLKCKISFFLVLLFLHM